MQSQTLPQTSAQTIEQSCADTIQSLDQCEQGQVVHLHSVAAGKRLRERLLSMGLPIGCEIRVLRNRSGAVVIARAANRLAIGKGMANKMMVSR
ncbi:MAG TPA: ferrous iron transport protein A [Gammaproteobacteria bacterium]|nr:ferrous iron transport protein A [Gammaproteobacteria bacterium]